MNLIISNPKPKAFAILGATASGKTRLALALAQKFPNQIEIISLDSALIYKDMNIGTAKPTPSELASVPHHLIDIVSPLQAYSVAEFLADCTRLVDEIHARGRLPLIVGGTMMYFHALTHGLNDLPEANPDIRAQFQQQKAEFGLSFIFNKLNEIDPITAQRLEPTDSQRIERALEVFLLTGKPLSQHFAEQKSTPALELFTLTLIPENRALLHEQIAQRFKLMLENGFLNEMNELVAKYPELNADLPSMRCVGYRQAWEYLFGQSEQSAQLNLNELEEKGIASTRQLAKRQLTWLRKCPADLTIDPFECDLAQQIELSAHALKSFFALTD